MKNDVFNVRPWWKITVNVSFDIVGNIRRLWLQRLRLQVSVRPGRVIYVRYVVSPTSRDCRRCPLPDRNDLLSTTTSIIVIIRARGVSLRSCGRRNIYIYSLQAKRSTEESTIYPETSESTRVSHDPRPRRNYIINGKNRLNNTRVEPAWSFLRFMCPGPRDFFIGRYERFSRYSRVLRSLLFGWFFFSSSKRLAHLLGPRVVPRGTTKCLSAIR